jgi:hypothetical protein
LGPCRGRGRHQCDYAQREEVQGLRHRGVPAVVERTCHGPQRSDTIPAWWIRPASRIIGHGQAANVAVSRPPLWRCERCGREFANRNQSHACGRHDLDHHFTGKPAKIRELFEAVLAAIREIGPVEVLPEKTRIAFHVRMSFAQVTPRRAWLDGHVVLARRLESPRFRRIETFSPRNHLHAFRLESPSDIDAEFRAWLAEAYAVGEQKHLAND